MSLRLKIIALFAATLAATIGVAAYLGVRIATQAIELSMKERTIEMALRIQSQLDLTREVDPAQAGEQLTAIFWRNPDIRFAELAVRRPGKDSIVRVSYGAEGPETSFAEEEYPFPSERVAVLTQQEAHRSWQVTVPVKRTGRTIAAIRIDTSLAEADKIAASERSVFFGVAGVGGLLLVLASLVILNRLLAHPLSQLARTMAAVESGAVEVAVPGAGRSDEIGIVARGLEAMLRRIRGFSQELQEKIDAATADLAEKNRALLELNDLLVEARRDLTAKERLAALGQLSGTIAHELGNPLNAISGHVQLLARSKEIPQPVKEELGVIENEVRRMTSIIRRFLDSARALTPAPEPVDVASLVNEAVSLTLSAESRGRISVEREVPSEMGRVTIDPALVRHVLTNFISNAVDAMPQGGSLTIRAVKRGDQLALSVSDSGPGLGVEERKHIFEPFYTTKPKGKGTGLGLAICREIAQALKGRIDIESTPGHGATFTLNIPAGAARASA